MIQKLQVVRGAKGLGWRESLAVSPLFFASTKMKFSQIARLTRINRATLVGMFKAGKLARYTVPHPETATPQLFEVYDLDGKDPAVKLNRAFPFERVFRVSKEGIVQYFELGVPRRGFPLSPVTNWVYWWLRQRIQLGRSKLSIRRAACLSNVPKASFVRAVAALIRHGWLKHGPDETLELGEADVTRWFKPDASGRASEKGSQSIAAATAGVTFDPSATFAPRTRKAEPKEPKKPKKDTPLDSPFLDEMLEPLPDKRRIDWLLSDTDDSPPPPLPAQPQNLSPPPPSPTPKVEAPSPPPKEYQLTWVELAAEMGMEETAAAE